MRCVRCGDLADGIVRIQVRVPSGHMMEFVMGMPLCQEDADSDMLLDELWDQIEARAIDQYGSAPIRRTALADLVPVSYGPSTMRVGGTLPQ